MNNDPNNQQTNNQQQNYQQNQQYQQQNHQYQQQNHQYQQQNYQYQQPMGNQQKSKMAAGLLGIFLGAWGIHNFYLGFTSKGIIQIVVTLITCGFGGIWGFIEGIMILANNNGVDANGIPLSN